MCFDYQFYVFVIHTALMVASFNFKDQKIFKY